MNSKTIDIAKKMVSTVDSTYLPPNVRLIGVLTTNSLTRRRGTRGKIKRAIFAIGMWFLAKAGATVINWRSLNE